MRLEDYNNEILAKEKIIIRAEETFDSSASTAEDIASAIKSVELIYQEGLLDKFDNFFPKLFIKINGLGNPTSKDLLFLARSLKKIDNNDSDFDNLNINADIIIGNRTLENFDDKVLEEFYKKEN